jgi:hypothetical protein
LDGQLRLLVQTLMRSLNGNPIMRTDQKWITAMKMCRYR